MDLLRKMLVADPKQRITANLALKHPYFEVQNQEEMSPTSPALTAATHKKWMRVIFTNYSRIFKVFDQETFGNAPSPHWMIPTMTPNKPSALPKIYTTRIFTNESGFWASAIAHPEPDTPTHILNIIPFTRRKDYWTQLKCPSRRASSRQRQILKSTDRCSCYSYLQSFLARWWPWWPHR